MPIVGYDNKNVYVHNQGEIDSGEIDSGEFIPIKNKLFDEARKVKGTDEDIIYIHRKK